MNDVDEHADGGQWPDTTGHQGRLGQVSVNNFRLCGINPATKPSPATGINEPPTHLKAQERDIGGGEFLCSLSAVAPKRNHSYTPISPGHSCREQDKLSLGSAHAVDCGNQIGN